MFLICEGDYRTELEDHSQKKKIMFLLRPEKDIKVSAKVLRKCFVSSLILLWQPKSAQSALSSTVFTKKIKNVRYIWRDKNILKIGMATLRYPPGPKFC